MPLDDADIEKISGLIGAALKTHGEEQGKATTALVTKATKAAIDGLKLDDRFKAYDEKLAAVPKPPEGGAGDGAGKGTGGEPGKGDSETAIALRKLQAELDNERKAREAQTRKAAEAEAARQQELLQNKVRDALVANGANPKLVSVALNDLLARKMVRLNDKGEPVFTFRRSYGADEDVAVGDGAKEWLGTDEGKFFVPATEKKGTGDRVERGTAGARKDGKVDWGSLAGRVNLGALDSLPE